MKHDCDIVRDLMPMCIDGTASEKTRQMVDEHVQECPPCDAVYREMQGDAKLDVPVQPQGGAFTETVKKMNKRRKRRALIGVVVGALASMVIFLALTAGFHWYFEDLVLMEDAKLSAVSAEDGTLLISAHNVPENACLTVKLVRVEHPVEAAGQYDAYMYIYTTRAQMRKAAAEVCFMVGEVNVQAHIRNNRGADMDVYRMLVGHQDGGGQIFYMDDNPIETVALDGKRIKMPQDVYMAATNQNLIYYPAGSYLVETDAQGNVSYIVDGVTATPMPTVNIVVGTENKESLIFSTPTPAPSAQP